MSKPDDSISWRQMSTADGGKFAAWILDLVDKSPDKLAIIEIPHSVPDHELDDVEDAFIRAYDRAKRERPNLSISVSGPKPKYPNAQGLVAVHEHKWVGGECVRCCGEKRGTTTEEAA